MSKITRENILDTIDFEVLAKGDPTWITQEVVNAMIAAYNRGIEDSVELLQDHPSFDVEACYKLKI